MVTDKPRALYLADQCDPEDAFETACRRELIRLHAANASLSAALEKQTTGHDQTLGSLRVGERRVRHLLDFAHEVRRTGDTRLASMAIAVINQAEGERTWW